LHKLFDTLTRLKLEDAKNLIIFHELRIARRLVPNEFQASVHRKLCLSTSSQSPRGTLFFFLAVAGIRDSLKQRGVRLTKQRQILLELIDQSGAHLDAEQLYQLAKEKDSKLNRVTVYRTLKLLKTGGLVDELDLMHHAGDQHYYETRMKQEHAHVICLRCGRVEEFFGEPLRMLRKEVEADFGFEIVLARTEVGGYCSHCQMLRAKEMEEAAANAPRAKRKRSSRRA